MDAAEHAWIERFLAHLHGERRLSAHTGAAYGRDLMSLAAHCGRRGIHAWNALDNAAIRAYVAAEHSAGLAPRSIQRRLAAARTFFEYLAREGVLESNPALDVRAPKTKKHLPETLDTDQMARLLEFRADDALSARDKAIMELFYSSGLRLAELVGLDLDALDLRDRTVRVLGKGAKTRIVPVGRQAVDALRAWLSERASLLPAAGAEADRQALFLGRGGRRLAVRAVQLRVSAIRTCFDTRSPPTCWNRAGICAASRNCWATPTSARPRFTPIWIFSTSPRSTTMPTRAPGGACGVPDAPRSRVDRSDFAPKKPRSSPIDSSMSLHPQPTDIKVRTASRLLEVRFDDGAAFELPFEYLRVFSPSAEVKGHGPGEGTLQLGKEAVGIKAVEPVGNYALRLVFDDGHNTGLYSWSLLYELGRDQAMNWARYLERCAGAGHPRGGIEKT